MVRLAVVLALGVGFSCATARADASLNENRQVQSIIRTTASPFCAGKTLSSCPSPRAGEWRRDVREWVHQGVTEPEIRGRLQARVPDVDLSIPAVKSGWVIPSMAVLLSTLWLVLMARRFLRPARRESQNRTSDAPSRDDTLDARLDEELALLDA